MKGEIDISETILKNDLFSFKEFLKCVKFEQNVNESTLFFKNKQRGDDSEFSIGLSLDEKTILYECCENNRVEFVKCLLNNPKFGPEINVNKGMLYKSKIMSLTIKTSPLYKCAKEGFFKIAKILLDRPKIDVNLGFNQTGDKNEMREWNKKSPLFICCVNDHSEVFKLLLNRKDINVNKGEKSVMQYHGDSSKMGQDGSPLFESIRKKKEDFVKILLLHPNIKIDFNVQNILQRDDYKLKYAKMIEIVKEFQEKPKEFRYKNKKFLIWSKNRHKYYSKGFRDKILLILMIVRYYDIKLSMDILIHEIFSFF